MQLYCLHIGGNLNPPLDKGETSESMQVHHKVPKKYIVVQVEHSSTLAINLNIACYITHNGLLVFILY